MAVSSSPYLHVIQLHPPRLSPAELNTGLGCLDGWDVRWLHSVPVTEEKRKLNTVDLVLRILIRSESHHSL